jgi:hypothetical protein
MASQTHLGLMMPKLPASRNRFPAQALFPLGVGQHPVGAEMAHVPDPGLLEENLPARNIDVSRDPHEGHEQPVIVRTVDLLFDGDAPLDAPPALAAAKSRAACRIFSLGPR